MMLISGSPILSDVATTFSLCSSKSLFATSSQLPLSTEIMRSASLHPSCDMSIWYFFFSIVRSSFVLLLCTVDSGLLYRLARVALLTSALVSISFMMLMFSRSNTGRLRELFPTPLYDREFRLFVFFDIFCQITLRLYD